MADVLQNVQLSTGRLAQVVALVDQSGNQLSSTAGVTASDGVTLPPGLAQTLAYTSGQLTSITVTYSGNTYVQTLTYTNGNLTGVSAWVKQ